MKTTIKEEDGNMVAYLEGSLDTSSAPECDQALRPLQDCKGQDIILDCAGLTYISSAGLRVFLNILKVADENGGHVYVTNMNDTVRTTFNITGFNNLFEFK